MRVSRDWRWLVMPWVLGWSGHALADFSLVEDFESKVPGDIGGQGGWLSANATSAVIAADPAVPSNQVLHRSGNGGAALSTLAIPDGTTATFFLRLRRESASNDEVFGLSDVAGPDLAGNFGVFEAQSGVLDANLRIRDRTSNQNQGTLAAGVWYQLWMVVNTTADTWQLHVQSDGDPAFDQQTLVSSSDGTINFRNGVAPNALVSFLAKATNGASTSVYYDDLYLDASGVNLSLPPIPGLEPAAVDDAVEVGIGGAIAFDPLANDTGAFDPESLEIVAAPAAGTAVLQAGKIVYRHAGSESGTDGFRYRIAGDDGGQPSEAEVGVTVNGNLRIQNVTAKVPLDPPATSGGGLALTNALPGLEFPGAVAVTGVPGSPAALLIASINGSIWHIPDAMAATPQKHLVMDLAERSNFTQGRSIYSIECFPDFASTGHVVVTYQGDKTRLPVPGPGQTVHDVIPHLDKNGSPYATITCDLRVSRFTLSAAHRSAAADGLSAAENTDALATEFPYLNLAEQDYFHSINDAKFGPDGYLYVSFGDEGDQGSPYRNTQTITKDQFSSIIRIDVDPASANPKPNPHYAIAAGPLNGLESPVTPFTDPLTQEPNFRVPADNPYVVPAKGGAWDGWYNGIDHAAAPENVRDEIWATGFRNPFKFHLDVEDGTGETEAWVGDVGKNDREEFTVVKKGGNAGWAYYEGSITTPDLAAGNLPVMPAGPTPHRPPLFDYAHTNGNNSATGGIFYRGTALPELTNRYVAADFGSGRFWSISRDGSSVVELTNLRMSSNRVVDFHADPVTGGIFVLENDAWSSGAAKLLRVVAQADVPETYPATLSSLGLFADLADLAPNPGVVPYEPNLTFWSDGAAKKRWMMVREAAQTLGYSADGNWSFPAGLVLVKHFDFDLDGSQPGTQAKRLETRVLVVNGGSTYGVSYRWNEAGTSAALVPNSGDEFAIGYTGENGQPEDLTWRIPARAECLTCHNAAAGHALSLSSRQLNRPATINGQSGNLLTLLSSGGYLGGFSGDPATLPRFHRPDETDAGLEERVRSYLAVNCAYCHQPGGGTPESWDGRAHVSLADTGILYGAPVSEGTPDATDHIIRPGDKANSSIWNKINARGAINGTFNGYTQMPPLATNVFDEQGIALIGEWIDHHANVAPAPAEGSLGQTGLSENQSVGHLIGQTNAADPDVRDGVADQSRLTYTITGGNDRGLFSLDPSTGELRLNGIIDYERQSQHQLTVEVGDRFAPNPGVLQRTVIVDLIDETAPDLTADSNQNGLFDSWETGHGVTDPAGDDDHDGLPAFFELLSGGNPNAAESPLALGLTHTLHGDHELAWNVRNGFVLGQDYHVERSSGLVGWGQLQPVDYTIESVTPVSPGVSRVVIKVPAAAAADFLRLAAP